MRLQDWLKIAFHKGIAFMTKIVTILFENKKKIDLKKVLFLD